MSNPTEINKEKHSNMKKYFNQNVQIFLSFSKSLYLFLFFQIHHP